MGSVAPWFEYSCHILKTAKHDVNPENVFG
jgi:hypothetical protein